MNEKFELLLSQVGRPYEMYNTDGTYQGCFYPVQFLYPDKLRYKLPFKNKNDNYVYGMKKLLKEFVVIHKSELKQGDIIATHCDNELHVAVYWQYDKIIHVFKNQELFISTLDIFKKYVCLEAKCL